MTRIFPWTSRTLLAAGLITGCSGATTSTTTPTTTTPVALVSPNPNLAATVGVPLQYDATGTGGAFSGTGLHYQVSFSPGANGLTAAAGVISGTPLAAGQTTAVVTATDGAGRTAKDTLIIVTFSSGLTSPTLPATLLAYADASAGLPPWYTDPRSPGGNVAGADNTPTSNPITDAGATLGRVLFHDVRLSANDRVSCSACHMQSHGFADTARFSHGFQGGVTARHSMGLANARYYQRGRFFWDERAATLEDQVLQPIQNSVEMGMTLDQLETKLQVTSYYPALFQAAFGSSVVTRDRIAKALAQYVRSIVSKSSKFDQALATGLPPDQSGVLTAQEQLGMAIYQPVPGSGVQTAGCDRCHGTAAHISNTIHNNGLDAVASDTGAGRGRFKAPSLRDIGARGPYMHDGRFTSLAQVVEHYNSGVQAGPDLDQALRNPDGSPHRLNLTQGEKDALVAFLQTLTDSGLATDVRFSSPFPAH